MFVRTCAHVYQSNCSLISTLICNLKTDRCSKWIPWLTRNNIYKVQIPCNWQVWHRQCQWKKLMTLITSKKNIVGLGIKDKEVAYTYTYFLTMNEFKCPWKKEHAIKASRCPTDNYWKREVANTLHFQLCSSDYTLSAEPRHHEGIVKLIFRWYIFLAKNPTPCDP